jgi:hypothetical protein
MPGSAIVLVTTTERTQPSTNGNSIQRAYITHCLHGEGVYRQAGFNIRAASTRDPLLLRFALEYPTYELPRGMTIDGDVLNAPLRLALVRLPLGSSALVYSMPVLAQDQRRTNNFATHALFAKKISPRKALCSWGSPEWALPDGPPTGVDLPSCAELPGQGIIDDGAVTSFLQNGPCRASSFPLVASCPPRLACEPDKRRQLVRWALQGALLTLKAGASGRSRIYLLAEPGLTALLVYVVARLLPEALASRITFSTYENAQRDLRTYRLAQFIGTWTAEPEKGLPEEQLASRGYILDSFNQRASPELGTNLEPACNEWIDSAAAGEWATIDEARLLLRNSVSTMVSVREGVKATQLASRLASGDARIEDVLELRSLTWARPLLRRYRDRVWPLVRDATLADPRLRPKFNELLVERIPELEQRAKEAFAGGRVGLWQAHLRLLWSLLEKEPSRQRDMFKRVIPRTEGPEARLIVLRELCGLGLDPRDHRLPGPRLFRLTGADELDKLIHSDLPRPWLVWPLFYALRTAGQRQQAAKRFHLASDELFNAFWEQFDVLKDETQRCAILASLFLTADGSALSLSRLLGSRCKLPGVSLGWLLLALRAFEGPWTEFWSRDQHLTRLIDRLRELGDEAIPVCDRLLLRINQEVLQDGGEPFQKMLLLELVAAKNRPGPAFPAETVRAIADWEFLREHFEKASAVFPSERQAVIDACNRRRLDPMELLRGYFVCYVQPKSTNLAVLADFAGFFHSFYLEGEGYQEHAARFHGWLHVVTACAEEEQRTACQLFYIERFVPIEFRRRLAEDNLASGHLPPQVLEALPRLTKPGGETSSSDALRRRWKLAALVAIGFAALAGLTWLALALLR